MFSLSYDGLGADAARLFRLLGLLPAGEFSLHATASLGGLGLATTRRTLAELSAASLITELAPGRYALHDLLRTYAADLVCSPQSADERDGALDRALDHYMRAAYAASQALNPHRDPLQLPAPPPDTIAEPPVDYDGAMGWFATNWPALRALVEVAATTGRDAYTEPIAWAASTYFERAGLWQPQADVQHLALGSAQRIGDRLLQLQAQRSIAAAYALLGDFRIAAEHFRDALELAEQVDNGVLLGQVLYGTAWMHTMQEHIVEALDYARRALRQFRAMGHTSGEARCLNTIGWLLVQPGGADQADQADQAVAHCEHALRLHEASGDTYSTAETWDTLGVAQHALGHYGEAIESFRRSRVLCVELGDRFREAQTLAHLADSLAATGDRVAARDMWQRAATLFDELAHPDGAKIRQRLSDELQLR